MEILDVKKELTKRFSAQPRNGFEYYKLIISNSAIIETGIKNLDDLLEGGLFTGNIYEICGLPATGKTLFCLTLMKNVVSKMKENIYYLDTKQDFSARKFKQMLCNSNKQELVEALSRALIKNISSQHELVNSLFEIKEKLQSGLKMRAVIIDSLPALYWQSADYSGNNNFLNHTVNILRYLSIEYNLVIIVTNLITLWNEGGFNTQDSYQEKISCGGYWHNVPNVRLKFERTSQSACKVTLMKTWKVMPEICECGVELTDVGIK
ncbi:DNA repair protein RAD51 homolog 4 isoform X2 [Anoplophora glabripennis]|uniref:DNA repair protein RAD51 homolog 4 isoform X2 n=1 Tax=Anoplophora glabripennis TaxID=217634 RepID=UPI0008749C0A|nr:DNA repair protein RAD51 homolog 4 isoform X2 [Anoplophora glabripennis]